MGHRILHLSDTHLTASGFDEDGVDAAASLRRILHDARRLAGLDLVVVSGDISDDGSRAGYRAVRELVAAFAAERGIPHVYTTGNHDDRDAFTRELGTGHLGSAGADAGRSWNGGPERAAVSHVAGLRVITLDSLVPGAGHGLISASQLRWLDGVLAVPSPAGSILVFHHPPVHVPSSLFTASYGLRNPEKLADVIAGSDVQAVLCGHFHSQLSGHLAGVPVWVTPGVVTRLDLTAPWHLMRAVKGASATVIDLGGPFSPAFHVIHARDPKAGEQVYLVDPSSSWAPVEAEDPSCLRNLRIVVHAWVRRTGPRSKRWAPSSVSGRRTRCANGCARPRSTAVRGRPRPVPRDAIAGITLTADAEAPCP